MCFGDLQLTRQSLSEFKQTIEVSFSRSVPQYRIMHYSKTTQPSALPLWKWFGLDCAAEDSSMPVVFIQHGDTMTCTSAQRKSNFVACHACETVYAYSSQTSVPHWKIKLHLAGSRALKASSVLGLPLHVSPCTPPPPRWMQA